MEKKKLEINFGMHDGSTSMSPLTKIGGYKTWECSFFEKENGVLHRRIIFANCRAWIGENIFLEKNPTSKYKYLYKFFKKVNINVGKTYIGIRISTEEQLNNLNKNLSLLHEKESTAGVVKTKIYPTQFPRIFIAEGSKYWKDSCWKNLLYTFYLKCLTYEDIQSCDFRYWNRLRHKDAVLSETNELRLLRKIKIRKEIFSTEVFGKDFNYGVHDKEGFVSICSGKNKPMADLLGVTKYED